MIDEQNSGATADDTALFESLTSGNPAPAPDVVQPVEPEPTAVVQPEPTQQHEPAIPPSRLREEADARRAAERELAELRGRIAAMEARQAPQQQEQPKADFWENPDAFVQSAVQSGQQQLESQIQNQREIFSKMIAEQVHGKDTVDAAYQAFVQAAQSNPGALAGQYQQFMRSENPYGELVNWHKQQQVFKEVGADPSAYRAKLLEDALKDPAFLAKALETARGTAQQSGNLIAKPAVSSLPSLNRVGATALAEGPVELDDDQLFSKLTTGRRK